MNLNDAAGMAVAFVLFVICVSIGGQVIFGIQQTQIIASKAGNATCIANPAIVECSTIASNASGAGLTGLTNLAAQSGTIGTVMGAAVLIGIVLTAFYVGSRQQ